MTDMSDRNDVNVRLTACSPETDESRGRAMADILPLNDLAVGETGVVYALDGGAHFLSRMVSFGFTPGVPVKMVQNFGHGAIIVSLRGTRVALGQGEARKVTVARQVGL